MAQLCSERHFFSGMAWDQGRGIANLFRPLFYDEAFVS